MVYTFNTHHTIKCVIIIFIWIQWNEAVMRHIIIRHWSWGKAPNIYIHNDFPHLAWGFTIYEKRALIWISSISSWVPILFSSVALSLIRWMHHYVDGFGTRRSVKGLVGLVMARCAHTSTPSLNLGSWSCRERGNTTNSKGPSLLSTDWHPRRPRISPPYP